MTNLISQAFKNNEKKLVTFVTGGDPDFETSLEIIKTVSYTHLTLPTTHDV